MASLHALPHDDSSEPVAMRPESQATATRERPADPSPLLVRMIALYAVETIEGLRDTNQVGSWVMPSVLETLLAQRTLRLERRTMYKQSRRIVPQPGNVVLSRPTDLAVESAVVMHVEGRSFAVAMRLEFIRSKWRATQLHVL